jgi:hypothetical protein
MGTDHSSHLLMFSTVVMRIQATAVMGLHFHNIFLCPAYVNSPEAAGELLMSSAVSMPVTYCVTFTFVFLGTPLCCMLCTSVPDCSLFRLKLMCLARMYRIVICLKLGESTAY